MGQHRIVDTDYGEIMLKPTDEKTTLDVYIGDNFDNYVGSIFATLYSSVDKINKELSKIL